MLFFFLPYGFIIILTMFILLNLTDAKTLSFVLFFSLIFEFLGSLFFYTYSLHTGVNSYCYMGKLNMVSQNYNISIVFIYDNITFFFHTILFIALLICLSFLLNYFEYDFNGHSIILLSSLFSQLAFIYFCTYDLFTLILFWEWISIVSFFLIQHWSVRVPTVKAALKVFTISQIGDYFFFIGVFLLFSFFETTDLGVINGSLVLLSFFFINTCGFIYNFNTIISFFIIFSVLLKSAQFVFFPWLLDAMEAPVPISAQLHSSTLVIIGFYILYRFELLILSSALSLWVLFIFSYFTIVPATLLGFFQDDGKKLLACSTASQLGYVILLISLGKFSESLYLLVFLCCNKAFTFVWFGSIMDKNSGISDFRAMSLVNWSFFEKSGLTVSILNSSVFAGSIIWHIKASIPQGFLVTDPIYFYIGYEVLSITWILSSLYLFKLYINLYYVAYRGKVILSKAYKIKNVIGFIKKSSYSVNKNFYFFISVLVLLLLIPFGFIWLNFVFFI